MFINNYKAKQLKHVYTATKKNCRIKLLHRNRINFMLKLMRFRNYLLYF